MTKIFEEDRRLAILILLSTAEQYQINEHILMRQLIRTGHPETTSELLREDFKFFEQHRLVSLEKIGDDMWIPTLLQRGLSVANGRPHEGIAIRLPKN